MLAEYAAGWPNPGGDQRGFCCLCCLQDKVKTFQQDSFLRVESDGMPAHPMMIGIRSWQQQVPLPQPYTGENAWSIPLNPVVAESPISAKTALYNGAIALAA